MFFDFKTFFTLSRLFDPNPPYEWRFLWWALGIYGVLIIITVILKIFWRSIYYQKLKNSLFTLGLSCGLMGLLLVFFRFEGIYFLSARFWHLLILIIFLSWSVKTGFYLVRRLPKEIKEAKERTWRKQFLPQSKKRAK